MLIKNLAPVYSRAELLSIFLLTIISFVMITTEFVVVGLLPGMASDLDISLADAGRFVTWFALAAAFIGPLIAVIGGRCYPHRFLILMVIMFSAGNVIIAWMPLYPVIIGVRLIQGSIIPGAISIIVVVATNIAGAGYESKAISQINMGVVMATLLGVPAGTIIAASVGWPISFFGLAVIGFASALLIIAWLPRIPKSTSQPSLLTEVSLLWQPAFLMHLLLSALLFTGMFIGYTYITPLLSVLTSFDGGEIGWILMGFGVAGAAGNWLSGRVFNNNPLAATICLSLILTVCMSVITPITRIAPLALIIIIVLWGGAHMAAFVITQVRVMKAGLRAKAFALSLNLSVCNLGIGLGSTLGGFTETHYGVDAVGYLGAATTAIALILAVIMTTRQSSIKPTNVSV